MTAPDWTEFAARRPFLTPPARRGAMQPATRLRTSPVPAILAVVGGCIRRMSVEGTGMANSEDITRFTAVDHTQEPDFSGAFSMRPTRTLTLFRVNPSFSPGSG